MIHLYYAEQGYNKERYKRNGDIILDPIKCDFTMTLNGVSEIEIEHHYDNLGRWEQIKNEVIIGAPTPYSNKQLFRVYRVKKDLDSIIIYARHIFFDLVNHLLVDVRPTEKNGSQALNIILSGTGFTGHSDITKIATSYYVRKNIIEAICGESTNTFISRWGGECLFDNFDLYVNKRVGQDKGVSVAFGKNMLSINVEVDYDAMATRIYPVGFDGIMLPQSKPYVDSLSINDYARIYTKVVKFEDIKVKAKPEDEEGFGTLEEAQAEMIRLCQSLFSMGADLPLANIQVDMAQLANTTAYAKYQILETVNIGDTVRCYHPDIEIDLTQRCIAINYNCLTKKYNQIELGDPFRTFIDEEQKQAEKVKEDLDKVGDTVNGGYNPDGSYYPGLDHQVNGGYSPDGSYYPGVSAKVFAVVEAYPENMEHDILYLKYLKYV